jgi:ATP-grasp domain
VLPLWFVAQRPIDALALGRSAGIARVVACEGGPEAELVAGALKCTVETLEDRSRIRRRWSNASVGEAAAELLRAEPHSPTPDIAAYASAHEISSHARAIGARMLAPDAKLKRSLDDKVNTRRALAELGLPVPPWVETRPAEIDPAALEARLGLPLVVQRRVGAAGTGTWVVSSGSDLPAIVDAVPGDEVLLVSGHVGDMTVNLHGFVHDKAVTLAPASVQAIGIPELVSGAAHYCGNDFTATAQCDDSALAEVRRQGQTIGSWLGTLGYRGVFGVDLVIGSSGVFPIDLNPRFQGSSWVLAELERAAGHRPTGAQHLAAVRGESRPGPALEAREVEGSLIVMHHTGDSPVRSSGELRAGIYGLDRTGTPTWRRCGLSPAECAADEIVLGGTPGPGVMVDPGGVLARVSSRRSLLESSGRALSELGTSVVAALP